jgi:hypothetical protein
MGAWNEKVTSIRKAVPLSESGIQGVCLCSSFQTNLI